MKRSKPLPQRASLETLSVDEGMGADAVRLDVVVTGRFEDEGAPSLLQVPKFGLHPEPQ